MIALFTDFGHDGLYVGQLHAVIGTALPEINVVDLCHAIPPHDICAAAYLLPAYTRYLPPASVVVCVVDPGVGSERRPHAVCKADGRWYIGPDNGLFDVLEQQAHSFRKYHFQWPGKVSDSFHARDIYTPAACLLTESGDPDILQAQPVETEMLRFSADLKEIIYFDHFGNAITGQRGNTIKIEGKIAINSVTINHARVFSDVPTGDCFWYENANGLVEIAANRGSAKDSLGLQLGDSFRVD
ncbi:MAG: SAM-dependent chlorinase/fluorinase [Gammaproteobacteria bacterium]|nr:MAG: SAM-dependent chlorinase/fluorinase [Gammaproteobacteria bacterium]